LFHYLRYILVFTQLIVISVFFYRFKVDQDIIDLKDSVKQKREIVLATSPLMKEVSQVNNKVDTVKKILTIQDGFVKLKEYIFSKVPSVIVLKSIRLKESSLEFSGLSADPQAVRDLYDSLTEDKKFEKINLEGVKKTEEGYAFSMTLEKFNADKK